MNPFRPSLLLTLAALFSGAVPASANLLVNGDFENGTYTSTLGGYTNSGVPVGWTSSAAFDQNPSFNFVVSGAAQSGSSYLSISNFDYQPLATLTQSLNDVVGSAYTVSFWAYYGAGPSSDSNAYLSINAGAGGVTLPYTTPNSPWQEYSFGFTGTGSDTLTIAATTNPSEWYVDNISVNGLAAPAPTPGMGLVGIMMLAAATAVRRRLGFASKR